ncbi:unnamed protein product [Sordaria macrospora k-hell]|uniref:WGS project CABT00000000 data, contig 2.24 n=1 Tax=Sordaria macrospora (strain ATCC MYA-333 / DSM 997 / K(L3346) / K-hell) TaxID=771870 RepID=F7W3C2_SORMK|nr:uncharacterized protein SMAC_05862 [Sordaria macrospora k-hell]CCC12124.1 unnamed protein product [Sordaria macrospora k-hell]
MAFGRAPRTTHTTTTTHGAGTHHADRRGVFHPILTLSNILIWLSSVIVLGISAYEIRQFKKYAGSDAYPGNRPVYILVIAVLTVAFSCCRSCSTLARATACCSTSSSATSGWSQLFSLPRATRAVTSRASGMRWRLLLLSLSSVCCSTSSTLGGSGTALLPALLLSSKLPDFVR